MKSLTYTCLINWNRRIFSACLKILLAAVLLLTLDQHCRADTHTWDANGASPPNGTYQTVNNWNPNGVPATTDTTQFNLPDTYTVSLNANATCDTLNVTAGNVTFASSPYTLNVTQRLHVYGGGTLNIGASGSPAVVNVNYHLGVGTLAGGDGTGTVIVSGSGSQLNAHTTWLHAIGFNGQTGTLTYTDSSTGTITGQLYIGDNDSAPSHGYLNVQGNADLTTDNLGIGVYNGAGTTRGDGTVTVTGTGSTITQTGASTLVIGASATGDSGSLSVSSGGTFTTGTGNMTVNALGELTIDGGTFNAKGNVAVDGGNITRSGAGAFNLASGKTLTASNGAQINMGDKYVISPGTNWLIQSGADLFGSSWIDIGRSGGTTNVTVDGSGSSFNNEEASGWGILGNTANVTYRNAASGDLGQIDLADDSTAGTSGTLRVESGANVTCGWLYLATSGGLTTTANVVVDGSGSTLTINSYKTLSVGHSTSGVANVTVSNSGVFTSGTGDINILKTGQINVTDGTFNANGNVNVDGGALTRSGSGAFNLASGKTLTASNNALIGMGSGAALSGGTNWNIQSGADLSASGQLDIGTSGGTTNVTVDGTGSSLTQSGPSALNIGHASTGAANITVSNGGFFTSGAVNINIYKTGQVNVTGGAFNANGNVNVDGGKITRSGAGEFYLADGKTLTASNNAQIDLGGWFLGDGTNWNIQSGADLLSNYLDIGAATVTVDGSGSTLNTGISSWSTWGYLGNTANVTYRNAASGTLGEIWLAGDSTAGTSGTLRVQSDADVTCGNLLLATNGGASTTANIVVDGTGSTLTQTGSSILAVGHASTGTASITVSNSGVFASGTGDITVYKTDQINVTGGTFNANGNVNVDGGKITRSGTGLFTLASGKTLTASNNAQIDMGMETALSGGTNWIIQSGADLSASEYLDIGTSGGTTNVTVDGSGSTLNIAAPSASSCWGWNGNTANVTFRNAASGQLGAISLPVSDTADASGTLRVESGANVICNSLYLAYDGGTNTTANVVVDGDASYLGINNDLYIGNGTSGTANVTVSNGGYLSAGNVYLDGSGSTLICSGDSSAELYGYSFIATNHAKAEFNNPNTNIYPYSFEVSSGADVFMAGGSLAVGIGTEYSGSLLMDGSDSTFSGVGTDVTFCAYGGIGDGVIRNGAHASFSRVKVAGYWNSYPDDSNNTATVRVESGAIMTSSDLFVAAVESTGNNGSLTITGNGSRWDTGTLYVGFDSTDTGTVNVLDHGILNVVQTSIRKGGKIVVNGGSADLGTLSVSGGQIDFQQNTGATGAITIANDFLTSAFVQSANNFTLSSMQELTVGGTTTIEPSYKLTLDGGSLTTGNIVVDGVLDFHSGTLSIDGGITGQGDTILQAGTDLTVDCIFQDTLSLGEGCTLSIRPVPGGLLSIGWNGGVNMSPVPEPATWLLVMLASISLLIWRRSTS